MDAHENQITSVDDNNSAITLFIQNSPSLKVLNLSHNQLTKKLVIKPVLLRKAEIEESVPTATEEKKKNFRNSKKPAIPTVISDSSVLLAIVLSDNKLEELKIDGVFEHMNTIIVSRNATFKKFVDFKSVPALTKFAATETSLENLDSSIVSCKQLQEIRLSHNPQLFTTEDKLSSLFDNICKVSSLKLFAINHNNISLPWDVMKKQLSKLAKNNKELKNLSVGTGNLEQAQKEKGPDTFKDELLSIFSKEEIMLSHLDDKLLFAKEKKAPERSKTNGRDKRENSRDAGRERGNERSDRREDNNDKKRKRMDGEEYQEKKVKQDTNSTITEKEPAKTEVPSSQLDDYQAIQIPKEIQEKLEREMAKRKAAQLEQNLVVQNAKDQQEEKLRKRELVGGYVEMDEKHSGVKKMVAVTKYKKKKPNVWKSLANGDEEEESW